MVEAPSDRDEAIHREAPYGNDENVILLTPLTPPALPSLGRNPLRFAPGGLAPTRRPRTCARRRPLLGLFDLAVFVLITACAAVCVYRLFWAIQP